MKAHLFFLSSILLSFAQLPASAQVAIWDKHEITISSEKSYDNPLYEVAEFSVSFTSPSGKIKKVNGFWDGGNTWKVRFMPDQKGIWTWKTTCSDKKNSSLNDKTGKFDCIPNQNKELIYQNGAIRHPKGKYYLAHNDGTPFFWLGCTAWNGALKSTPEEWDAYLKHRKANNYNIIQLVTTQWRGGDMNEEGLVAYEGAGRIRVNPEFFKRMDKRIDRVNEYGLVASPIVLWAHHGQGRELNPGYYLPINEAVLLAKYIVARYQGNHVIWHLGGDGQYLDGQESKWRDLGRKTFGGTNHAPVTLHPHGRSYVGNAFVDEDWYSLMTYQSSHSAAEGTVNWINKGPMSQDWNRFRPMPYINTEPCYEQIGNITNKDVRNACYWSLFATPPSGITYGANGIWPWLRKDNEPILNHGKSPNTFSWSNSLGLPGSLQMGYLAKFFTQFDWWNLIPANEMLISQPGETTFNHWISVLTTPTNDLTLVYIPVKSSVELLMPDRLKLSAQWFDPVKNSYSKAVVRHENGKVAVSHEGPDDAVLVLKKN